MRLSATSCRRSTDLGWPTCTWWSGTPPSRGSQTTTGGRLRAAFDGPYIANGGYDRLRGDWAVASGAADLVAFGQAFLANPDLPERFRADAALNQPDPATFYGGDSRGYTDYPALDAA